MPQRRWTKATRLQLRNYLDNQRKAGYEEGAKGRPRKVDLRKKNVPIPLRYALMLICDRWPGAGAPWDLERHPDSDRIRYYMNLMGLEGQFKNDLDGVGPRDEMDWGDDE